MLFHFEQEFLSPHRIDTAAPTVLDRMNGAGMTSQLASGLWALAPYGQRLNACIEDCIKNVMSSVNTHAISLPQLQPQTIWQTSERLEAYGPEMFTFSDRNDAGLCLGPTHEEVVTLTVKSQVSSYKQLPLMVYQIGRKFRDELRPRHGLVRAREFSMKDAYSFALSEEDMMMQYAQMKEAYALLFSKLGLDVVVIQADNSDMGGLFSEEFLLLHGEGESHVDCIDGVWKEVEEGGQRALELGHIFSLGTRYSDKFGFSLQDRSGAKKSVLMGCYGIGITRLMVALCSGEKWSIPSAVAPYQISVLAVGKDNMEHARALAMQLANGHRVLLDTRDVRFSQAINEHESLGIPNVVVVGRDAPTLYEVRSNEITQTLTAAETVSYFAD